MKTRMMQDGNLRRLSAEEVLNTPIETLIDEGHRFSIVQSFDEEDEVVCDDD